ncbi:hypothetical protein LYSHEL_14030 [Lysobacter helvus]|uniref:DUF4124 domain-containing protein n=2 Tax=Lysobacteraceae TaxID=32033 RepID=A0ABM7Q4Z1_9GAMM|nr:MULTISPECIES: hypothetical protein [Lysobacter]BCT92379.1 hypothetical protein LYSCAS_14030 [Lysobacter caseinilyticus]BCT95532.1 hypothetical protein LYSHEL_14030 [Lysobacter helvus]
MPANIRINASLIAVALLATSGGAHAQAASSGKKLYCWDDNGRKVCGDALPAEAAGNHRAEYSERSGRRVGEVARALTPEEQAAADAAKAAAATQAETDAARMRREMAIVESYATENDLRKAFQERIDLLDETLKASSIGVSALRQTLVGLLRQAGELELAGKPVPEIMRNNIATQHAELGRRERMYTQQQGDRAKLDDELEQVLARYREIKQGQAASAQPATAAPTGG